MIRRTIALLLTAAAALALGVAPAAAQATGGDDENGQIPLHVERDVVYRTVDGRDLRLDVYRPDDDTIYPALLDIHGGGWIAGNKEQEEPTSRMLAEAGFVVFTLEYRMAPADPYPAAVEDVQAAVEWARANAGAYGADPAALGALGGSAGGHLAAMVAVLDGPQVDAAVSWAGPMDLADPDVSLETKFFFASFIGCLDGVCDPADLVPASPITHVTAGDAPLFLANSQDDPLVPVAHAERMAAALDAVGVDYELVTPPTGEHVPGPVPVVTDDSFRFLRDHLAGDDPVLPTTPGSSGGDAPADSDDRGFEIALLVMAVAAIVLGACLIALSRRRRPRPRSPLPAAGTPERTDSLDDVTTTRDTSSVGRRT